MESVSTSSLNQQAKASENHQKSDVDFSKDSQHHTIGTGPNQAASGHDVKILQDLVADLLERVEALETP